VQHTWEHLGAADTGQSWPVLSKALSMSMVMRNPANATYTPSMPAWQEIASMLLPQDAQRSMLDAQQRVQGIQHNTHGLIGSDTQRKTPSKTSCTSGWQALPWLQTHTCMFGLSCFCDQTHPTRMSAHPQICVPQLSLTDLTR